MEFGAFVELEPGVEGLVHISELSRTKTWRVADAVQPEQMVAVRIISIDPDARRISLSMKDAVSKEAEAVEAEEETGAPVKPRPRNVPLRGGVGQETWLPQIPGKDNTEPEA
jgi:small subunit ribosomal protein S1